MVALTKKARAKGRKETRKQQRGDTFPMSPVDTSKACIAFCLLICPENKGLEWYRLNRGMLGSAVTTAAQTQQTITRNTFMTSSIFLISITPWFLFADCLSFTYRTGKKNASFPPSQLSTTFTQLQLHGNQLMGEKYIHNLHPNHSPQEHVANIKSVPPWLESQLSATILCAMLGQPCLHLQPPIW